MKILPFCTFFLFSFLLSAQPIALHPKNPHYLIFKGEPTLLITSAEHKVLSTGRIKSRGAVVSLEFEYDERLLALRIRRG